MIIALQIELLFGAYADGMWKGMIEIDSDSTLEELHFAIQDAVDFDRDHLFGFFIARTERSRDRVRFDDENGEIYSTTLEKLFPLPEKRHLYYLFDYGDYWIFKITKKKKSSQEPDPLIKYPRLIQEVGVKPEQYPALDM
jgi:hypothetical protein